MRRTRCEEALLPYQFPRWLSVVVKAIAAPLDLKAQRVMLASQVKTGRPASKAIRETKVILDGPVMRAYRAQQARRGQPVPKVLPATQGLRGKAFCSRSARREDSSYRR